MIDKHELREKVRRMKRMLTEAERLQASLAVFQRLENTAAFQLAEKILMYHSLPDEVSTIEFLKKWNGRKRFFLPRVNGVNLEILPYDVEKLVQGSFHILEPVGEELTDPSDIELIVTPAVAYDRRGNRIGRGKGFYDRLLKETKATKIGVVFHFQLSDEDIASEPHDVPVDMVITDSCTILVNRR